jgi:DNA ligase-1
LRCGAARRADAAEAQAVVDAIAARRPASPARCSWCPSPRPIRLSDEEFAQVDREIRAHTLEKFGPVRSVRPTLVFELGFEGINHSPRHKSGIAVRFPRMLRQGCTRATRGASLSRPTRARLHARCSDAIRTRATTPARPRRSARAIVPR